MGQSFAAMYSHIVFSTKNRERVIHDAFKDRLFSYIGGIIRVEKCNLLVGNGVADHVHLLVSMSRTTTAADLVGKIKSNSSAWVKDVGDFP